MRYDKLTVKAQEAVQAADSLAHSFTHGSLDADHLLLALVEQKDGVVPPLLERIGADAWRASYRLLHPADLAADGGAPAEAAGALADGDAGEEAAAGPAIADGREPLSPLFWFFVGGEG
mgnify:CR=1 FL=1